MNKHEEIKEYVSMMEHTLRRRMDGQQGKEELINEYTDNMEKGLLAIDKLDQLEKDIKEFIELYLKDIRGLNIDRNRFSELRVKLSKVGLIVEAADKLRGLVE